MIDNETKVKCSNSGALVGKSDGFCAVCGKNLHD